MSYTIGLDTLLLRPTPRVGHAEYCSHAPLHRAIAEASGGANLEDAWACDLIWNTSDGPVPWNECGRTTDMGHAEFLEGGTDRREAHPSPFRDVEEVWAFDALQEYGTPDPETLIAHYEALYQKGQRDYPNQVFTGGYYKTMISGAIEAFGWEMLLSAAADLHAFERVIDSIFQLSLHHYRAWAKTSAEVFISHDDMVWSQGPFLAPSFYRNVLFPRYQELWKPLKAAGKRILFCSDANWDTFVPDIANAGADGFIIEPIMDLNAIVSAYGQSHVIVGSKVDCRTLTLGTQEDIRAEVDATLTLARHCPGFIAAVGNHIPSNVPIENALYYFDYLQAHWNR